MTQESRTAREQTTLFIVFTDLSSFTAAARKLDRVALAEVLNAFYVATAEACQRSGGRVVKYLGDGALLTWPADRADDAVSALISLRATVRSAMQSRSLDCTMITKCHVGEVEAGQFGPADAPAYDVIGEAVFTAARLPAKTISLSAEAFRRLRPETRQLLVKHTPPVVYIPAGDPRP